MWQQNIFTRSRIIELYANGNAWMEIATERKKRNQRTEQWTSNQSTIITIWFYCTCAVICCYCHFKVRWLTEWMSEWMSARVQPSAYTFGLSVRTSVSMRVCMCVWVSGQFNEANSTFDISVNIYTVIAFAVLFLLVILLVFFLPSIFHLLLFISSVRQIQRSI